MISGYNHNIKYKDEIFHIQTENSGSKNPIISTLLYHKGIILASKKTNYSDFISSENLDEVVVDLMQQQHKSMIRELFKGEFDNKIEALKKEGKFND